LKGEKLEQLRTVFKEEIKTFISIYGFMGDQKNFINRLADNLVHKVKSLEED